MDEENTGLLEVSKSVMELLERIYLNNLNQGEYSIEITDKTIINELKNASSIEEKNDVLIKHEKEAMYPFYAKKCFIRLLGDFCLYMYESLRNLLEFKPQIAYTLARKPLIDDIFYLQYLYIDADKAVDLVLSDDAKDKDVGTRKNRALDKKHSDIIIKDFGYKDNIFYSLRYEEPECGILYNCNKAMHITISRNDFKKTQSGELNFIFMEDKVIEDYTKLYLHTVPTLLFYWDMNAWMKNVAKEGNVDFPNSKKPEKLIQQIIEMCTQNPDYDADMLFRLRSFYMISAESVDGLFCHTIF